jgi:hypothetical protein
MIKLSKEKQQQLILVGLGSVAVIVALYFLVIADQAENLVKLNVGIVGVNKELTNVYEVFNSGRKVQEDLQAFTNELAQVESKMIPANDSLAWIHSTLRAFMSSYSKDSINVTVSVPPSAPADVKLFPNFPFKASTFTLEGEARFHQFGRFLADFENGFPYFRVVRFTVAPATGEENANPERVRFVMDVSGLVSSSIK